MVGWLEALVRRMRERITSTKSSIWSASKSTSPSVNSVVNSVLAAVSSFSVDAPSFLTLVKASGICCGDSALPSSDNDTMVLEEVIDSVQFSVKGAKENEDLP